MQEVDGNESKACEAHAQSRNQLLPSCETVRGAVLIKLFFCVGMGGQEGCRCIRTIVSGFWKQCPLLTMS